MSYSRASRRRYYVRPRRRRRMPSMRSRRYVTLPRAGYRL